MSGRQYRAVPVPDVCTRYTCSSKHLRRPFSSSMLVRGGDANSGMPIVMWQVDVGGERAVEGSWATLVAEPNGFKLSSQRRG